MTKKKWILFISIGVLFVAILFSNGTFIKETTLIEEAKNYNRIVEILKNPI